jgi:hypothetical protein
MENLPKLDPGLVPMPVVKPAKKLTHTKVTLINDDLGLFSEDRKEEVQTLRDQFATAAMNGVICGGQFRDDWEDCKGVSEFAYEMADAMLKAREKR